jgi:hypothetical protein
MRTLTSAVDFSDCQEVLDSVSFFCGDPVVGKTMDNRTIRKGKIEKGKDFFMGDKLVSQIYEENPYNATFFFNKDIFRSFFIPYKAWPMINRKAWINLI